jgi:predicted nucleic acid-binding protein
LQAKFPALVPARVDRFLRELVPQSLVIADAPATFALPRDPKDEQYINLAIAARADYLVTWNMRHMGYLMKNDTPEGRDFCARFPGIKVVEPPTYLRELDGLPQD